MFLQGAAEERPRHPELASPAPSLGHLCTCFQFITSTDLLYLYSAQSTTLALQHFLKIKEVFILTTKQVIQLAPVGGRFHRQERLENVVGCRELLDQAGHTVQSRQASCFKKGTPLASRDFTHAQAQAWGQQA